MTTKTKKKPTKYYYIYRSAKTGKFVSKAVYEKADPKTVIRIRVLRKSKAV